MNEGTDSSPLSTRDSGILSLLGAGAVLTKRLEAVQSTTLRHISTGIQVAAVSFVGEGVAPVLDIFQEHGAIDTVHLKCFTYGRALAGRQIPGHPFPDHGSQEGDKQTSHGGNYARLHPEYFRHTSLKESRAPEHCDSDVIEAVLPKDKQQGTRVICSKAFELGRLLGDANAACYEEPCEFDDLEGTRMGVALASRFSVFC